MKIFNQKNNMIKIGYFMTIITLYKQGESQRKIARLVGHDRKTVRRIIKLYKEKGVIEPIRKQKESALDGYKDLIIELMGKEISGVRIHEELIKEGLKISYPSVARYLESIKGKHNVCVRFHTTDLSLFQKCIFPCTNGLPVY